MEFHPYAEEYPLLTGDEFESFKEDIEKNGQREPVRYRIKDRKSQGLDGRNRWRACQALGIKPRTERVTVPDEEVESYIDSLNLHRRHLTPEQRKARVKTLRADGQSTRAIADTLGVDQKTVRNDIASSAGEEYSSPETPKTSGNSEVGPSRETPATVTGRDGKSYPAKRPEGLIEDLAKLTLSPKIVPELEKLSRTDQFKIAGLVEGGVNVRKALEQVRGREAGDDGAASNSDGTPMPRKKPGKPFDDKKITETFGTLARLVNDRAKAYGQKSAPEEVREALNNFLKGFRAWKPGA